METKYKEHTIIFREEAEEWFCEAIGVKSSLKAAKAAIDAMDRKDRQIGLDVLMLARDYRRGDAWQIEEVRVSSLCQPSRYDNGKIRDCFVTSGKTREKVSIADLYPLDCRAELQRFIGLNDEAIEAKKKADAVRNYIPRFNADSLLKAAGKGADDAA